MKSIDQCIVSGTRSDMRLPFAEYVVMLRVTIVVRIRGGESLVVRLARKNFGKPTV